MKFIDRIHILNVVCPILIIIFTIIAIYIVLYVGLGLMCPIGESDNYAQINQILLNLSYSYLAALLFFILIEYIPSKILSKKAYNICKPSLENIYLYMSEIIGIILLISQTNHQLKKITIEDLKGIKFYKPSYKRIYYKSTCFINGKASNLPTLGVFEFKKDLKKYSELIENRVKEIASYPSSSNLCLNITDILSELSSSKFLRSCVSTNDPILDDKEYEIASFDTDFLLFLKCYIKLGKYNFTHLTYKFEYLTTEEIERMEKERTEIMSELQNLGINLGNQKFYKNNIEYKVENGKLI